MAKRRKRFSPLRNITKSSLDKLPDKPIVYGIFTGSGKLQKVGRAKRYRAERRISESAEEIKQARRQAKQFGFITTQTVQEAIKLETRLIKSRKPPLNKERKGK